MMKNVQIKKAAPDGVDAPVAASPGHAEIRRIFDEAELVDLGAPEPPLISICRDDSKVSATKTQAAGTEDSNAGDPIVPFGHNSGVYYFLSPSRELRSMRAEALEAGRGVRAIFAGIGSEVDEWCWKNFPINDVNWCPKKAGNWIIEQCNAKGVFHPDNVDQRSIGVWRDDTDGAVAHCGDGLAYPDGRFGPLQNGSSKAIMIGAKSILRPDMVPVPMDTMKSILHQLTFLWGWKRPGDAELWLGWLATASLGGFPDWRTHLYVHGSRGSGKSKLMELAACLLGDLAGEVVNDATEAGLRQSRNNQARPLLIDEFEPDDNPSNASRQDSMLALFRRMSGGAGGRIARGGADHKSVSFRALGAVYVTSINHILLEPQDRSRFVMLELDALPNCGDPAKAGSELTNLFQLCRGLSARFRGRMLAQSVRWQAAHAAFSNRARVLGADTRQADTAATIVAGLDLALFDGDIDSLRMEDHEPLLRSLIEDASESGEASEGNDALDHLLSTSIPLDQGIRRTVRELLDSVIVGAKIPNVDDAKAALARVGIFVLPEKNCVALRSGKTTPTAKFYTDTKWKNGAHASALLKIKGVVRSNSGVRVAPNQQHRMLLIPFDRLECVPAD